MANSYTQFCTGVTVHNDAEKEWFLGVLQDLRIALEYHGDGEENLADNEKAEFEEIKTRLGPLWVDWLKEEFDENLGFECEFEGDAVYFVAEENGEPYRAAMVIQAFLKRFYPSKGHVFCWALSSSRSLPDQFGGGVAAITATNIEVMSTWDWGHTKLKELLSK